jgi:hypothetical protein
MEPVLELGVEFVGVVVVIEIEEQQRMKKTINIFNKIIIIIGEKMKKLVLISAMFVLLTMPTVFAKLQLGEPCLINEECESGWCINVCVPNPCTDKVCNLQIDCFKCPEVNGYKGDCRISDCGFATERCSDGVCDVYTDCFCDNYGDCGYVKCLLVDWKRSLTPILITSIVVLGLVSYVVYKKIKRR